jgi:hypothetical protein
VRQVLNSASDISFHDEWSWPEGGEVAPNGARDHHFAYVGQHSSIQVAFIDDGHGRVKFVQSFLRVSKPIPQTAIEEAEHLMDEFERRVTLRCGLERMN